MAIRRARLFQIDNGLERNAVVRTNPLSGRRFPLDEQPVILAPATQRRRLTIWSSPE